MADKTQWDESIVKDVMAEEVASMNDLEVRVMNMLEVKMSAALDEGIRARECRRIQRPWNLDVSSIGYCVRKQVLARLLPDETEPIVDADFMRSADIGNAIGDNRIRDLMQGGWVFIGEPEGIDTSYRMMGHADGLSSLRDAFKLEGLEADENGDGTIFQGTRFNPGDNIILEIKSVRDFSFKNIIRAGMPRDRDLIQSHIYAHMFNAKVVIHLVEKRSGGEQWVGAYPVSQEIINYALRRAGYVWECIDSGLVPERPYPKSTWHCEEARDEWPDPAEHGKTMKVPTGRGKYCDMWAVCQKMETLGGYLYAKSEFQRSAWKD